MGDVQRRVDAEKHDKRGRHEKPYDRRGVLQEKLVDVAHPKPSSAKHIRTDNRDDECDENREAAHAGYRVRVDLADPVGQVNGTHPKRNAPHYRHEKHRQGE